MIAFLISRPMKRVGLILPPAILAHANGDGANWFVACPFRLKRVGFVMSAVCPVYPEQQTFADAVGTSHLGPARHRQQLHGEAVEAAVRVSLSTVYDTLHQFIEAGLLREVVVNSGHS
jgi:hypothetical protein